MQKHNIYDKEILKARLAAENFNRTTLSFYRYVNIADVNDYRDKLYDAMEMLKVMGRIYIAHEGVNAQLSIPEHNYNDFTRWIDNDVFLSGVPLKIAVEDDGKSFYKLIVRIKNKIVADGLPDEMIDFSNVGTHLTAREVNEALENDKALIIDMRNHYESEVGKFENALCPDADTFRDALPQALKLVEDKKDSKIILYCTGGIRCEKASAYFKHHGFNDVNQLYGGIIEYARQIKAEGLPSKFIGKNFVFDERMGERITEDVIAHCHQCGEVCDHHVNCANDDCHLLFIQCEKCSRTYKGCCTPKCMAIAEMAIAEQKKLRKGKIKHDAHSVYKSRLRPHLSQIISEQKKLLDGE